MLQRQFLQQYAPFSLALLYFPIDTGSPGHDISEHISKFATHRIDLQETQIIGGRVIGHIEHDLGPADDSEMQHRILTIPYAERRLAAHQFIETNDAKAVPSRAVRAAREIESNPNAVEFVRVIKECAGLTNKHETDPRSLQVWASWAYDEIQQGLSTYNQASGLSREEHKAAVVTDVLTRLGRWAMELTAVTATTEELLADEPEVYEYFGQAHSYTDGADDEERQTLSDHVYRQVLHTGDTTDPFKAELRSIKDKMSRSGGFSKTRRNSSDEYKAYLQDEGVTGEDLDSMIEDFERVTEQYTEDGAVSLHMSDGEKFVVDGTIEEDIDLNYLPQQFADIVSEIHDLFTSGVPFTSENEGEFTINRFIQGQLDLVYGSKSDDEYRIVRTIRTTAYLPAELRPTVGAIESFAAKTREELEVLPDPKARHTHITNDVRRFAEVQLRSQDIDNQFKQTIRRMLPAIVKDVLNVQYGRVYEFHQYITIYANAERRRYVEEVLDHILQNMSRDFILSAKRHSKLFRSHARAIEGWTDTRKLIDCIQRAYTDRKAGKLNIKQFTALDTLYQARRAALETKPLVRRVSLDRKYRSQKIESITVNIARNLLRGKNTQATFKSWVTAVDDSNDPLTLRIALNLAKQSQSQSRLTKNELDQIVALYETKSTLLDTPSLTGELSDNRVLNTSATLINETRTIQASELQSLALRLHTLPLQEKERVRNALREAQPVLYEGIKKELAETIISASTAKLMYLRFAFYEDKNTGAPNQPHNKIHLLNEDDRAAAWELLKSRSGLAHPS